MMQCGKSLLKRNIFMAKTQFIGLLAFTNQIGKMPGEVLKNLRRKRKLSDAADHLACRASRQTPQRFTETPYKPPLGSERLFADRSYDGDLHRDTVDFCGQVLVSAGRSTEVDFKAVTRPVTRDPDPHQCAGLFKEPRCLWLDRAHFFNCRSRELGFFAHTASIMRKSNPSSCNCIAV